MSAEFLLKRHLKRGITVRRAQKEAEQLGIRNGRPRRIYRDETIRSILDQRLLGVPPKVISDQLQIPLNTVYYILRRHKRGELGSEPQS